MNHYFKMNKKIGFWIFFISILVFISTIFYNEYSMKNYGITCAKFVQKFHGKSSWFYVFEYKVNGKILRGVRDGFTVKMNEDELRKIECIKMAYSMNDKTNIRILDKNVGNEWLWFVK